MCSRNSLHNLPYSRYFYYSYVLPLLVKNYKCKINHIPIPPFNPTLSTTPILISKYPSHNPSLIITSINPNKTLPGSSPTLNNPSLPNPMIYLHTTPKNRIQLIMQCWEVKILGG